MSNQLDAFQELMLSNLYDDHGYLEDKDGNLCLMYSKVFGETEILFDEKGIAYLTQADIARLLGVTPASISQSISGIVQAGFTALRPDRYVKHYLRYVGQGRQRLLEHYSMWMVNIIAGRMRTPSEQALQFLEWRETIFENHQDLMHQHRLQLNNEVYEAELKAHFATKDLESRWEQELQARYPEELGEQ
jgi:DNA-binding MarR family transcriptional regulator